MFTEQLDSWLTKQEYIISYLRRQSLHRISFSPALFWTPRSVFWQYWHSHYAPRVEPHKWKAWRTLAGHFTNNNQFGVNVLSNRQCFDLWSVWSDRLHLTAQNQLFTSFSGCVLYYYQPRLCLTHLSSKALNTSTCTKLEMVTDWLTYSMT